MRIEFTRIQIKNFKSIGEADIDLHSQGIVKVLGLNEYENNASSNGSGKSSIFMALFWVLYGRDPKGIINPTNRYASGGCSVSLSFSIDNNMYEVIRSIRGSSSTVTLYVNGDNMSAQNKGATDKIIKEDILKMPGDIFLSLIYLSQGFSNRLTALSPTARKARLEQLTNTSALVEAFNEKLAQYEAGIAKESLSLVSHKAQQQGFLESVLAMQAQLTQKLAEASSYVDYYEDGGTRYYAADMPNLHQQLAALDVELTASMEKLNEQQSISSTAANTLRRLHSDRSAVLSNQQSAKNNLDYVNRPAAICPTCKQALLVENAAALQDQYSTILQRCEDELNKIAEQLIEHEAAHESALTALQTIATAVDSLKFEKSRIYNILNNIPTECSVNTADIQSQMSDLNSKASDIESNIQTTSELQVACEYKSDIIKHCRQLVTKSFRAYLLDTAIQFLNARLRYYSSYLFSNDSDVIKLDADSTKLEIYLGEVLYDTLSGGEERKVDLAIVLAQRDLAAEIAGTSCNLLVLDEIMESMDEKATQITLQLLEKTSESVDSLFIISHNNYTIPADTVLNVVKHDNRVASVHYGM